MGSRLSAADVAAQAGVDRSHVDRLIELGILVPGADRMMSAGDVRRVTIVRSLERAGVAVEGVAAAVRAGTLSFRFADTSTYERFAALSSTTFAELAEQTGIPLELLAVVRRTIGGVLPAPEDRVREDELLVVPLIELQLSRGFRPAAIERWIQAYGDGMRRIAETEEDYFTTEVARPLVARGLSPAEALDASHELSPELARLGEQALLAIYHAHQARSWTRGIVEFIEAGLEAAGVHSRLDRVPAMAFLDLTGYTRLTEERGDAAAAQLAERLGRIVTRTSARYEGEPVKWLGDGVMFHFARPGQAVLAALDMVAEAASAELPPAHVGIHAGPVLFQEGDYFGRTVNVASRVADYARPGEVLVTRDVVDAAPGLPVSFAPIGPVELKGLAGTIELHSARRARSSATDGQPG